MEEIHYQQRKGENIRIEPFGQDDVEYKTKIDNAFIGTGSPPLVDPDGLFQAFNLNRTGMKSGRRYVVEQFKIDNDWFSILDNGFVGYGILHPEYDELGTVCPPYVAFAIVHPDYPHRKRAREALAQKLEMIHGNGWYRMGPDTLADDYLKLNKIVQQEASQP